MTMEERIQRILGAQIMQIASLSAQLDQAQAMIAELEKEKPDEPKAD